MGKIINNGIVYGGGSSVELDATLSIEGKAADAQAVGKALGIELTLADYEALSEEEKSTGTYWINDSNEPLGDGSRFLKTTDVVDSLDVPDPTGPLSANMGRKLNEKINNIYILDYNNPTIKSFKTVNETFTIPEDGIITISWRNAANSPSVVGITSAKRKGTYIYLDSRYSSTPIYAWHECIVEKGDILTVTTLNYIYDNVDVAHYPFKK